MDYIPQPHALQTSRTAIVVPLLSHTRYEESIPFEKYPEHQGWGERTFAEWFKIFENPPAEFQAFIQRWLLFAPLQAFGGNRLNDLVWDPERSELTLGILPQLAQQWLSIDTTEINNDIFISNSLIPCLNRVSNAMIMVQILSTQDPLSTSGILNIKRTKQYTLAEFARMPYHGDPCHPEISIAISSMLTFIRGTMMDTYTKYTGLTISDHARLGHTEVYPEQSPIWRRLVDQGWCPFQLALMSARFNTAGLAFMSLLRKPQHHRVTRAKTKVGKSDSGVNQPVPKTGRVSTMLEDAESCSRLGCVHRQLTDDTYIRGHVGHQICPDVVVREEEIKSIFLDSTSPSFPLIVAVDENDPNPEIRLVPWRIGVPFIAISHLWSDGLGNLEQNAIPRCQLRRLSKYTRDILGNVTARPLFWLDTICVPPDAMCKGPNSTTWTEIQKRAIHQMKATYEQSTVTLVLDDWLMSTKAAGMTNAAKMMQIFSCAWNTRLWTYQEGALAKSLYFQFADTTEDLDQMKELLQNDMENDIALRYTLGERLIVQYNCLRGFRTQKKDSEDFVLSILRNMAYRSTSVASDEALCLSTLMGLETSAKPSTEENTSDPEEPMAEFWRRLPCVPSSLLLASTPTMSQPGLSWAPRSTLLSKHRLFEAGSVNTLPSIASRRVATLSPRGLEIQAPGLLIGCDKFQPPGTIHVLDDRKFYYEIVLIISRDLHTNAFEEAIAVLVVDHHDRVEDCTEMNGVLQPLLLMQPYSSDGTMAGRKIGTAIIRRMNNPWDTDNWGSSPEDKRFQNGTSGDIATRKLGFARGINIKKERWCIE